MMDKSVMSLLRSHASARFVCVKLRSFSFFAVTRLRTFVRVARIVVRGRRVLIFRGCDHLSDTTRLRPSDIPCRQADTTRVTM